MQSYQAIRSQIITKAWKDETFKKRLMMNPKEVWNEFGLEDCGTPFSIPSNPSEIHGLSALERLMKSDKSVDTYCCPPLTSTNSKKC